MGLVEQEPIFSPQAQADAVKVFPLDSETLRSEF